MQLTTPRNPPAVQAWRILPALVVAAIGVALLVIDTVQRRSGLNIVPGEEVLPDAWGWLCAVALLVQAGVLLVRYRLPRTVLVAVTLLDGITLVVSSGALSVGTLAVMVATITVWKRLPIARAGAWLGALAAVSAVVAFVTAATGETVAAEWAVPLALGRAALAFGAPALGAELVRSRRQMLDALRERAILAERDQQRSAREAVQRERAQMARELHDIAAHHLSGIIVGAQAADALLDGNPVQAREYLHTVKSEAQRTLANLRHTVGLLRDDSDGELAPVLSIGDITALIDGLRARGARISQHEEGQPRELPPLAGIAAFRMVQESLTNAGNHAPGSDCYVDICYGADSVQITVTNGPSTGRPKESVGGGGHGLVGMRERAALVGGTIDVGATDDGGWSNSLVLPLSTRDDSEVEER